MGWLKTSKKRTPVEQLKIRAIEDDQLLHTVEFQNRQEGRRSICTVAVYKLYMTTEGRTTNSACRRSLRRLGVLIRYKPMNATFDQDLRIYVARELDGRVIFEKSANGATAKVYRKIECSGRSDNIAAQMVLDKLDEVGVSRRRAYASRELDLSSDIVPRELEVLDEQEDLVDLGPEANITDFNTEEMEADNSNVDQRPGPSQEGTTQKSRWSFEPQPNGRFYNEYNPKPRDDYDENNSYFLESTEHRNSPPRDENPRWRGIKNVFRRLR
ncbi:hypothetical protein PNOK_0712100 [Pyrrhoderma noxium]|uniref:Uncharacterized protein n=1 Tax=Pyrrhoderma noxium TaxID=2282107 RepID=A0A286UBX2_9AGAM|nr:hypothetical protein PNOK_0712100 [Pyrrhoderma noxium]